MAKQVKKNKIMSQYGAVMVRDMERIDGKTVRNIRQSLNSVSVFVDGLIGQMGQKFGGPEGKFNYRRAELGWRGMMKKISTFSNSAYIPILKESEGLTKDIYTLYRTELTSALEATGGTPKVVPLGEAVGIEMSMQGTISKSLESRVKRQLQAGLSPAALIKTVSQEQVRIIQRQLLTTLAKGKSFGWGTDRILKEMFPRGVARDIERSMEKNLTRIIRTSYMNAVNMDTMDFVSANPSAFSGSRRVADGRPCLACISLDGMYLAPGIPLNDHPNGMCIMVPLVHSNEFLLNGTQTSPINDLFDITMTEKFYKASESVQRKMFQNGLLYDLWREEQFDLDKIPVGKFNTPISFQAAASSLDEMGAISAPQVGFSSVRVKSALNPVMDPKDRLEKGSIVTLTKPRSKDNKFGMDVTGDGSDFLESTLPVNDKTRIQALYGDGKISNWLRFNARARVAGIWTRKTTAGDLYYVQPD